VLPREQLERDQSRASAGRALVLKTPPQQLELLPVAELPERPVRDGALTVVGAACGGLDLLVPLRAQTGKVAFRALLGEPVRLGSGCGQVRQR
jgi:hypothetical protein